MNTTPLLSTAWRLGRERAATDLEHYRPCRTSFALSLAQREVLVEHACPRVGWLKRRAIAVGWKRELESEYQRGYFSTHRILVERSRWVRVIAPMPAGKGA